MAYVIIKKYLLFGGYEIMKAVITVVGQDRVGIVYEVSKLLAEQHINIVNISQQIMDHYFTMIILVDLQAATLAFDELSTLLSQQSQTLSLDIRIQNNEIFTAMHRI